MLQICLRRRTAGRCGASSGILSSSVEQDRRKLVDSVSMTLSGLECRGEAAGEAAADGGKARRFSGAGARRGEAPGDGRGDGTGQASAGGGGAAMAGGRWRLTRRGGAPRGESSASRLERFGISG